MKLTFNFETNMVTDDSGTIYVEGLDKKKKAILDAAGLVETTDSRDDFNLMLIDAHARELNEDFQNAECVEYDFDGNALGWGSRSKYDLD